MTWCWISPSPRLLLPAAQFDFVGGMGRTFQKMLPSLPRGIAFELELYAKRDVFLKVPFFAALPVPQIMALVPRVTTEDMMPGRVRGAAQPSSNAPPPFTPRGLPHTPRPPSTSSGACPAASLSLIHI